ncbi:TRAP transporter small permease [Alkalihalobacillus sp. MEB130]|uniref:TRAP transporter small permease n=1 Tax=Alkalihalobacillus sp. MEB130 TaxID=2976704 RepID=UPI0028E06CE5|nr:TRAP transporter small permease [Alkalihalobacillus sp. MEB130]MDT8858929.1 TRAP transporter small permease [Alkalihalobacillus sp. MEB130]
MRMLFNTYVGAVDFINRMVGYVLALMLSLMSIFICWQVFARKVIGSSLSWSEEVSRFLMVWVVLLGAAYALKRGELIAVEILPEYLSDKGKKIIFLIVSLISLVFYVVLMFFGWQITQSVAVQIAPGTGISMFWVYLSLPVGGALLILNTLYLMIKKFT